MHSQLASQAIAADAVLGRLRLWMTKNLFTCFSFAILLKGLERPVHLNLIFS